MAGGENVHSFNGWLCAAMATAGIETQGELRRRLAAEGVEVTRQTVSGWCQAEYTPAPDKLAALARVLGCSREERDRGALLLFEAMAERGDRAAVRAARGPVESFKDVLARSGFEVAGKPAYGDGYGYGDGDGSEGVSASGGGE